MKILTLGEFREYTNHLPDDVSMYKNEYANAQECNEPVYIDFKDNGLDTSMLNRVDIIIK